MFSCSEDKSIRVFKWSGVAFELTYALANAHSRPVYTLTFDPVHRLLFSVK